MSIKVGLVGAGFISGIHQRTLSLDPRVEVAGVYDIDPSRDSSLMVDSLQELFDRSDAIYICTPNTTHAELAISALRANNHVFCEKPMATNVEDARRVYQAAEESGTVFQVGHNRRFANVYKRLQALLRGGPAHTAHIKMNRGELLKPSWVGDAQVTGGFLFETPIHMFDQMRFQFGEIVSIDARESRKDDFSCLVEFANGMHATFVTSGDASWYFPYESIEAYGEYSTVQTFELDAIEYRLGLEDQTQKEMFNHHSIDQKWGFAEADQRFIDAIVKRSKSPVTAFDGLRSVEITVACYQSAREKRRIDCSPRR